VKPALWGHLLDLPSRMYLIKERQTPRHIAGALPRLMQPMPLARAEVATYCCRGFPA